MNTLTEGPSPLWTSAGQAARGSVTLDTTVGWGLNHRAMTGSFAGSDGRCPATKLNVCRR
jgi:hypothetical protein